MTRAARPRRRPYPYRALPHPAGRRFRRAARGRPRCCSAATAPARPRRCAPSWACGSASGGADQSSAASASKRAATPDIARPASAMCRRRMAVFSDLTVQGKPACWRRATAARRCTGCEWIFGFFPALKRFWLSRAGTLSGGQKQMLSIARAIVEPRRLLLIDEPTKGLAPAIVGGADRMPEGDQAPRRDHPAGRAEFPCRARARRHGRGDGQRPHRARGEMAALAADVALQERLLGPEPGGASVTDRSPRPALPKPKRDIAAAAAAGRARARRAAADRLVRRPG